MLFLGLGFFQSPLLANTKNGVESGEDILLNITTVSKNQYYMVKSIVLDKHNVEYLSDDESEIYEFKYNEDIINNISERDLFIYYGLNNEPWINVFIGKLKKGDLGIINMSRGIKALTYERNNEINENPYYWLGVNEYKIALYNIKSAIQEKDPKNKNYYEENYINNINEVENLVKDINTELEKLKDYTILTNTNTFDYLLKGLGLQRVIVKEEITNGLLKEKNLDEDKVIFLKEKTPIDTNKILAAKKDIEKLEEVKKIDDEDIEDIEGLYKDSELKKIVEIKEVELTRWDEEKTLIELASLNIKLLVDTLKNSQQR